MSPLFNFKRMKIPIAVFITDTHLKEDNVELVKSIFEQSLTIVKNLNLSTLFHGGDFFHSRASQPQNLQTVCEEILLKHLEEGITLYMVPGNHDKTDYKSDKSFLDPFNLLPVRPSSKRIETNDKFFHIEKRACFIPLTKDILLTMTPFFDDEEYIENIKTNVIPQLESYRKNFSKIIHLTHVGFQGSKMNSGKEISSKINRAIADLFDLTLVGHYHDYQELYEKSVIYIGSAYQGDFGENNNKGLTVLYDDLSIERIKLQFPEYVKLKVDIKDLTTKEIVEIGQQKNATQNIIRVVLQGNDEEVSVFNKQELLNLGIQVEKETQKIIKEDIEDEVEKFEDQSLHDSFIAFCKRDNLDIVVGEKYLNKVINV